MTLQEKIDHSIALIHKAEKLALTMQPDEGFYVGFSGGKDSQAVLELVKMAGVKYRAVYNVTTNDPADNVRFIKHHYPDVEFSIPEKSYFQLIAKKGVPTMLHRWCCALFKETAGVGYVVLTGVRKEESSKRAKYEEVFRMAKAKKDREYVDLDKMEANEFRCVGGKDKFIVYPILEWTEKEVWDFIALRGLPVNPCYKTHKRVGCVFCPFSKAKYIRAYCKTHPQLEAAFIHAIERYLEGKEGRQKLPSAEDYFDWWLSHISLDEYIAKKRQFEIDFDPATGETQWMQQSYLTPTQQPLTFPTAAHAAQPSEGNVQAFLDQARRQEQALQPRQAETNDLPVDDNNEDIFDNNDNEETPF